jgi:two-component system response regulator FixJ
MGTALRLVHVLDDDVGVRHALGRSLRIAGYAVALYETSFTLLDALPTIKRGCLLLDVRMPDIDGLALQSKLGNAPLALVLMTGHGDVDMAVRAMQAGAVDFLEKPFSDARLIAALDIGFASLSPTVRARDAADAARCLAELSPREGQVLMGLAEGKPNKTIAHDLGISVRTAEVHRARMLRRLSVTHLADAIRLYVLAGLAE